MEEPVLDLLLKQGGMAAVALFALFIIYRIFLLVMNKMLNVIEENTKAVAELTELVRVLNGKGPSKGR